MSFIKLENLTKSYGGEQILAGLNLDIEQGEFISIVGPYGSGKSTILRILSGLSDEHGGSVTIRGHRPEESLKNRKVGYSFQHSSLLPWKSVKGNLSVIQEIADKPNPTEIDELLKLGGLEKYADHHIDQLSGGMRQILSILRALVLHPDILILDEPFSSIDELSREKFQNILRQIHQETSKTTVMVTHSLQEAVYLSDRVVVLSKKPAKIREVIKLSNEDRRDRYGRKFNLRVKTLKQALMDE